ASALAPSLLLAGTAAGALYAAGRRAGAQAPSASRVMTTRASAPNGPVQGFRFIRISCSVARGARGVPSSNSRNTVYAPSFGRDASQIGATPRTQGTSPPPICPNDAGGHVTTTR